MLIFSTIDNVGTLIFHKRTYRPHNKAIHKNNIILLSLPFMDDLSVITTDDGLLLGRRT